MARSFAPINSNARALGSSALLLSEGRPRKLAEGDFVEILLSPEGHVDVTFRDDKRGMLKVADAVVQVRPGTGDGFSTLSLSDDPLPGLRFILDKEGVTSIVALVALASGFNLVSIFQTENMFRYQCRKA